MSLQALHQILQVVNTPVTVSPFVDNLNNPFEIDPLACSVSYFRTTGNPGISRIEHVVSPEDYEKAKVIREYYSKKYFWNSLKSTQPQSEFRNNAMRLLAVTEGWNLSDRDVGFFVKLPCFYQEDIVYDKFKETLETKKSQYFQKGTNTPTRVTLEFIGKTFRWQNIKRESYWFRDSNARLYCYTTNHNHPFNKFFEEKIERPCTFELTYGIDNIADMWYNAMRSFEIIKEENA